MVDISAFLLNRISNLLIGFLLAFVVSIIVLIFKYFLTDDYREFKETLVRFELKVTISLGLLFTLMLFFGELSLISYIDLIHGGMGILFFVLLFLLGGIIIKFSNTYGNGIRLPRFISRDLIPKIAGPGMFLLFFIFVFTMIFVEDISIVFIVVLPLIFLLFIVFILFLIINGESRNSIAKMVTHG